MTNAGGPARGYRVPPGTSAAPVLSMTPMKPVTPVTPSQQCLVLAVVLMPRTGWPPSLSFHLDLLTMKKLVSEVVVVSSGEELVEEMEIRKKNPTAVPTAVIFYGKQTSDGYCCVTPALEEVTITYKHALMAFAGIEFLCLATVVHPGALNVDRSWTGSWASSGHSWMGIKAVVMCEQDRPFPFYVVMVSVQVLQRLSFFVLAEK